MQRTILVVDDDAVLLEGHEFLLARAGYRVLTAPDGAAGLEMGLLHRPDLIILDLLMPRVSGFAVLEQLRDSLPPFTRFIMLTGNGAQAHRNLASFLGADEYLEKPVSCEQLLATVRALCPLASSPTLPVPAECGVSLSAG